MGVQLSKQTWAWRPRVDDGAFNVLQFMALTAHDKDRPGKPAARFWGGPELLAIGALGRHPTPAALKEVQRRLRRLVAAGAVTRVKKGGPGQRAEYAVNVFPDGHFALRDDQPPIAQRGA